MELRLRDFESINLFSNKNLEKVMASVVNKSSNSVLINMFEDSLILLDHTTGQFYSADYKFDQNKLTIKIDNFEPVELIKEDSDLREKIVEYFDDDEEISTHDLTEVYKDEVMGQEKFIDELIHDAMMAKDFTSIVDWSKVKEVKEDVEIEDEKFFKAYQKRLETHPLMEVKLFDWQNPVYASLVDTEPRKIVNDSAVERASELWKKEDFKEAFADAASTFVEDVEEGTDKMKDLLETYPQIFFLSGADRKALFGKAIITNKELKEEMEVLLKGIDIIFEKFDLAEMKNEYLEEAEFGMDEPPEEPKGAEAKIEPEKADKKPKEAPPELSAAELGKLATELENLADKCEDEACKEKIKSIAGKLKAGKEEGTRPDVVKEAVSILSL